MSGVLIGDGRHATGRAGVVLRRAFAQGGVTDIASRRSQLSSLFPVDSLRDADLALLRISDREWYVVKDRHGRDGQTVGPEEVSEILAVQRRRELGLPDTTYDPPHLTARERGEDLHAAFYTAAHLTHANRGVPRAEAFLEDEINAGRVRLDGSDITVHLQAVEDHGAVLMPGADVKFTAVTGLPLPVPHVTIHGVRGPDAVPLKHANDAYVDQETERLAQRGLSPADARNIAMGRKRLG